jgi:AcrR family transcriptional regulator
MLMTFAARRFQRLGYHRVSLADVAADAGVTAPAVYRHFSSKEELLAVVIKSGLDVVDEAIESHVGEPLSDIVIAVTEVGLDRPDLWVLLQREARFLGREHRRAVQGQLDGVVDTLSSRLVEDRPLLSDEDSRFLVAGATSVLSTPSAFHLSASRPKQHRELARAAIAVLGTKLPAGARRTLPPLPAQEFDRRSELLRHATDLFFRRGYVAVTLDDIGAAVGITGPTIYHYFTTKVDLLVAAFDQAVTLLAVDQQRPGHPALEDLVRTYIEFCLRNRALVGVYVSEAVNLPAEVRHRIAALLKNQVSQWSTALLATERHLDRQGAQIRVQSALTVIADSARLGHFYTRPAIAEEIEAMAVAILVSGA